MIVRRDGRAWLSFLHSGRNERVAGVEPAFSPWKSDIIPLYYTRIYAWIVFKWHEIQEIIIAYLLIFSSFLIFSINDDQRVKILV